MFHVCREIHFSYGHRILHHGGKCRYLHGHNGKVIVDIAADQLDDLGMVVDFSEIKRQVQTWIAEHLDHRMILRKDDPAVPFLTEQGEPMFLMDGNPTAENLARLIYKVAREAGLPVAAVTFWETNDCCARYGENVKIGRNEPRQP